MFQLHLPEEHVPAAAHEEAADAVVVWSVFGILRRNAPVLGLLVGTVFGTASTLVTLTLTYSGFRYDLAQLKAEVEGRPADGRRGLQQDMVDVDRRLNEAATNVAELRRLRDQQITEMRQQSDAALARLDGRLAVVEEQLRWFLPRIPVPQPGVRR